MSIVITGAAGFIGSQLAYRLYKEEKKDLILIDNFSYGSEDNLIFDDKDFRDEILKLDIRDEKQINEIFKNNKVETCYHIAAITPLPDCQSNPSEAIDVNVRGTLIMLEAARRYGCQRFVFASTSAVYENDYDFPSQEKREVFPSLIYPNTKFTCERFCQSYVDCYGMNIACLRFANVYGPHMDCLRTQPPVVAYLVREYLNGRHPVLHGDGSQSRDYIYVEDLLDLTVLVGEKVEGFDIVNVGSNTTISVNELALKVQELMGLSNLEPECVESSHYWVNYPDLYQGAYSINQEVLDHEVNKYTQLDNRKGGSYGWQIKHDLDTGLKKTIAYTTKVLKEHYEQVATK